MTGQVTGPAQVVELCRSVGRDATGSAPQFEIGATERNGFAGGFGFVVIPSSFPIFTLLIDDETGSGGVGEAVVVAEVAFGHGVVGRGEVEVCV